MILRPETPSAVTGCLMSVRRRPTSMHSRSPSGVVRWRRPCCTA